MSVLLKTDAVVCDGLALDYSMLGVLGKIAGLVDIGMVVCHI